MSTPTAPSTAPLLSCKFGDEEDFEEVSCTFDNETEEILCRPPLRSRRKGKRSDLIGAKMMVTLKDENTVRFISPLITEKDDGAEAVELHHVKPIPMAAPVIQEFNSEEIPESSAVVVLSRVKWWRKVLMEITMGCIGEMFGTMILTTVICSLIASSVLTGSQSGVWQVALPGGLAVSLAIYLSSHLSEGHLNSAVTISFTIWRWKQFKLYRTLPHIVSQMFGAFTAAMLVYLFYNEAIVEYEASHNITRGEQGSQVTATIFARYFPNPTVYDPMDSSTFEIVPVWKALLIESWATFILVFVIFSLTHPGNATISKHRVLVPLIIGTTVAALISIYGPLTQTGINPAFDFGPRLFATMAGWGSIALPGPRNGFWVYIAGPIIGGVLGGGASDLIQTIAQLLRRRMNSTQ